MIIYKDLLTDDELISDVYDLKDSKDYPGCWEVECKMISVGGEDFVLEGANASAEGEDAGEGVDDSKGPPVLDIVHAFRLAFVPKPDKKGAMAEYKKYMKAVVEKLKEKGEPAEKIDAFRANAQISVKKIAGEWDEFEAYGGESYDVEIPSMLILVKWRPDDDVPIAIIWKDAVTQMKV